MKLNIKVILIAGLAFYVTQFIVSMLTGQVIHTNILEDLYRETSTFWRPELNQDPPDMAALMPRWIAVGVIAAFIITAIYDNIRSALNGSAITQGAKFGFIAFLFSICLSAGWSGVFNLPDEIWIWWNVEALVIFLAGGTVLGYVTEKLSPE